ncbi:uncharacterized protein LOC119175069 [Rhipicephalus microplus]|nr:uncharacterized protein LOC119175069 [Rhipicephalus microplus]
MVWAQDGGDDFDGSDDFGGSFGDGGFVGDAYDGTVMQSVYAPPETIVGPTVVLRRKRRSVEGPVTDSYVHRRVRRGGYGVVGPVHTYVRTDYDGNFKWGARHHVGKSYGGHAHHY